MESCCATWTPIAALVAPGPRVTKARPGPAGQLARGFGHERGAAFLPADDEADPVADVVERVQHRQETLAGHAERMGRTLCDEARDEELAAGARAHQRPATTSSRFSRNTLSVDDAGVEPEKRQPRERELAGVAVVADLDHQHALRIEEARGVAQDASHRVEPVLAARERHHRLVPVLGRQLVHRVGRDVRRVADDEVVGLFRQVGEQVRADQVDAVGEAVFGDVALRDGERVGRQVDRVDVGVRIGVREQDREAARAGAQVERRGDRRRVADERGEPVGQQLGDERARDDHALVDVEAELAEPGLVRQVGGRHALVDAPREQLGEPRPLGVREPGVEERLEPVQRQVQRVQDQVRGLVVAVGRAVAEREPGLAEAGHRVAQPVAQRDEVLDRRGAHRESPRPGGAPAAVPARPA